ncbi:RIP metalloprotease RseP [Candidatus Fermentibacteria bacterium]|nr:MAG: RIP metalloprotease RseP [Candidatus Fermentibacteria bacterium]
MLTFAAVIVGLGMIVFFHELGHFAVAKAVGLPVERFSMGFPPFIFRRKAGETEYCIGAVPLGGYVKVNLGVGSGTVSPVKWWKRSLVVLAGPLMNLVLAAFLMFTVLAVTGTKVPLTRPVVGSVHMEGLETGDRILEVSGIPVEDWASLYDAVDLYRTGEFLVLRDGIEISVPFFLSSDSIPGFVPLVPTVIESTVGMPAYEAGMRSGDSITTVNGVVLADFADLQREVAAFQGRYIEVVFVRNAATDTAWVEPMDYQGRKIIGVTAIGETETVKLPVIRAAKVSISAALEGAANFYTGLIKLAASPVQLVEMSGGPVFVAETLGQQAGFGLSRFLETIAYFSLAIMGFNLIPLPVLDGGQFLFILFEGIRGKPASPRVIQTAQQIGIFILLLLFAAVIFRDISRVVTRVR